MWPTLLQYLLYCNIHFIVTFALFHWSEAKPTVLLKYAYIGFLLLHHQLAELFGLEQHSVISSQFCKWGVQPSSSWVLCPGSYKAKIRILTRMCVFWRLQGRIHFWLIWVVGKFVLTVVGLVLSWRPLSPWRLPVSAPFTAGVCAFIQAWEPCLSRLLLPAGENPRLLSFDPLHTLLFYLVGCLLLFGLLFIEVHLTHNIILVSGV